MSRFVKQLCTLSLCALRHGCNHDLRNLLWRLAHRVLFEHESAVCREYRCGLPPADVDVPRHVLRQVETYEDYYAERALSQVYYVSKHYAVWLWIMKV
jgi:hypothetical protein